MRSERSVESRWLGRPLVFMCIDYGLNDICFVMINLKQHIISFK